MTNLCQRAGCPREATHAVKFCAADDLETNGEALMDLRLCELHATEANPLDFLRSAPALLTVLGLTKGEEGLVFIEPVPLQSVEFKAFKSLQLGLN